MTKLFLAAGAATLLLASALLPAHAAGTPTVTDGDVYSMECDALWKAASVASGGQLTVVEAVTAQSQRTPGTFRLDATGDRWRLTIAPSVYVEKALLDVDFPDAATGTSAAAVAWAPGNVATINRGVLEAGSSTVLTFDVAAGATIDPSAVEAHLLGYKPNCANPVLEPTAAPSIGATAGPEASPSSTVATPTRSIPTVTPVAGASSTRGPVEATGALAAPAGALATSAPAATRATPPPVAGPAVATTSTAHPGLARTGALG